MKTTKRKRESATAAAAATPPAPPAAAARESKIDSAAAPAAATASAAASPTIVLASHCALKDAAALKATLCAALDSSEAVTVDVGAVERIDTATIQLLCAFVRDRGARKVEWRGASAALNDAAKLLGIRDMLNLPDHASQGAAA